MKIEIVELSKQPDLIDLATNYFGNVGVLKVILIL